MGGEAGAKAGLKFGLKVNICSAPLSLTQSVGTEYFFCTAKIFYLIPDCVKYTLRPTFLGQLKSRKYEI